MQQSHELYSSKKRKNIYSDILDEDGERPRKKQKVDQDGQLANSSSSQIHVDESALAPKKLNIEMEDEIDEMDSETDNDTLIDHIRKFKLDTRKHRVPDPKLQQIFLNILNARNLMQRDAVAEISYSHHTISQYRNSHPRPTGWNNFEANLLDWAVRNIDILPPDYKMQRINKSQPKTEIKQERKTRFKSTETHSSKNLNSTQESNPLEVLLKAKEPEIDYEKILLAKPLPESVFSRISMPKYLEVSDEKKADLKSNQSALLFSNIPQKSSGLQIDCKHLPYLEMPKASEKSNDVDQATSRLIYEKMLEAWQIDDEFQNETKTQTELPSQGKSKLKTIKANNNKPDPKKPKVSAAATNQSNEQHANQPHYSSREAAFMVLKKIGKPLSVKEITRLCLTEGYLKTNCKTVDCTIAARMYDDLKKKEKSWFIKVDKNLFTINPNYA